jgi:chromosome segregation ATPase
MASEQRTRALDEVVMFLEQQLRAAREEQTKTAAIADQLRRQIHEILEITEGNQQTIRAVDAKFLPFRGLPDKLRGLDEGTEHLRQAITANRAELESALRILQAEAEYDRHERSEAVRRIEAAASQLSLVVADVSQIQSQVSQLSQSVNASLERQREVEALVEQFGLRLDRSIEVHRDLEQRVRSSVLEDQENRFALVFERLQVVGEMVRRNEELIKEATAERTMREEVLQELGVWRDQHNRIDARIAALEEAADRLAGQIDRLRADITLQDGRQAGLNERVASIRRDIAEVVDHVREEFAKYNKMVEKQRRKQIQGLEQELREMKFHAFRPPEEP